MIEVYKIYKDKTSHKNSRCWEVSNFGNVKCNGELYNCKISGYGYKIFCGGKYLHKVVAELFIGNIPKGYEVDHIDTNKLNNRVDNLRICTHRDNMQNPITHQRQIVANKQIGEQNKITQGIPVVQLTSTGVYIKTYVSASEAARQTGIYQTRIREAILGLRNNKTGYLWVYASDYNKNMS